MTRLTDVDELQKKFKIECAGECAICTNNNNFDSCKLIDSAPIVDAEPVVQGQWLKAIGMMPPEWFGRHVCSVCDHFAPNDSYGTHEWLSPICPYCGAKMKGD